MRKLLNHLWTYQDNFLMWPVQSTTCSYMIYYQEETNENETMKRKLFDANRKITQLEERVTAVQVNH